MLLTEFGFKTDPLFSFKTTLTQNYTLHAMIGIILRQAWLISYNILSRKDIIGEIKWCVNSIYHDRFIDVNGVDAFTQ